MLQSQAIVLLAVVLDFKCGLKKKRKKKRMKGRKEKASQRKKQTDQGLRDEMIKYP
jgi:hypothetical protein